MTTDIPSPEVEERVAAVLAAWPVLDGHNDLPEALRSTAGYSVDGLDQQRPEFQTDLVRLRRGGVGAQFWSAWVPPALPPGQAVQATLEQIDAIRRLVAAYPERLAFARSGDDVRAAWAGGRLASLIGVEGGHSIGRSAAVLRQFARLGVRYMTLTHSSNVPWADSGTDEPAAGGLTDEGRAVVALMNELGVIVDLSHVAATTMRDALDVTRCPVLFSHSSAFAVTPHPRNVPDDVLERLAANGGVVQATFVPSFVSAACWAWQRQAQAHLAELGLAEEALAGWREAPRPGESAAQALGRTAGQAAPHGGRAYAEARAAWESEHPRPRATIEDVVAHVEHLREVAGVDHVGLGGDYDGVDRQPEGLRDVTGYPRLLAALAGRGWSDADLAKLTSRNVLRVVDANPVSCD